MAVSLVTAVPVPGGEELVTSFREISRLYFRSTFPYQASHTHTQITCVHAGRRRRRRLSIRATGLCFGCPPDTTEKPREGAPNGEHGRLPVIWRER